MRKIGLAPSYAQWSVALVVLLVSSGLLTGGVGAEEHAQPIKIGVLTDLKAAKALGLTIAPEVLYRADRVIR